MKDVLGFFIGFTITGNAGLATINSYNFFTFIGLGICAIIGGLLGAKAEEDIRTVIKHGSA